MSKSMGNTALVDEVVQRVRPVELRYYLATPHYRSTIEFTDAALDEAAAGAPGRPEVPSASLGEVPEGGPEAPSPAEVFDEILGESAQVALLLDADGFVTAGRYVTADGNDLGALIGAHLSGVSGEADRAMRHFGLGRWTRIVLETEAASVAMAPYAESVVLVAAPRGTPLGFVRRTLDRCAGLVRTWLGEGA
jgi:predicted regulator of Ras-like GTPase activity (Roadblock/LC7/MglB family)